MSHYGATPNVPYTGQADSDLVNNPRYTGQSGGTVPYGATGPQQESRYGAAPVSTTGNYNAGNSPSDPLDTIRNPAAYGFKKEQAEGFRYPGTQQQGAGHAAPGAAPGTFPGTVAGTGQGGYGPPPTTGGYGTGVVDANTRPSQSGYDSQPTGGYGAPHQGDVAFAQEQPGYGQPGFGAPSQGHHTGNLWPHPTSPPNAHKVDTISSGQPEYGQGGYDLPQRKEGVVDKVKDAVGVGPRSHGAAHGQEYTPDVNHPHSHGTHDQLGSGYNTSAASGADARPQIYPRREGVKDKVKDAVGVGPRSHSAAPGREYNPNVHHPSSESGFGGGLGHHSHGTYEQPGGGYNTGMAVGADAYTPSQPPREGVVDKVKDAAGVGPNSGYDSRTQTGNDAYVHGNHPAGMQDRLQGVNEPRLLGGENVPVGGHDGAHGHGEYVPDALMGEKRSAPGYDTSKGHFPGHGGHHENLGGVHNTGLDTTDHNRRREEDSTGVYDSKLGTGTGTSDYNETPTETGYDDATTTGTAPPKKGLMTKIKEKLHH